MVFEHLVKIAGLRALAGDEAELFQCFHEKRSNVLLAVDDTDARPHFSSTERGELGSFFDRLIVHDALRCVTTGSICNNEVTEFAVQQEESVKFLDKH